MKKVIGVLMCICMCIVSLPNTVVAKEKRDNSRMEQPENVTYVTSNVNQQDYSTRSSCVKSYLVPEDTGYLRIQALLNDMVLAEHYDYSFTYLSHKYIEAELPIFGGFYAGKENYYLVWGQENKSESDSVEVLRVVKYDKSWNRISSSSVYGANTYIPFKSGSLRMTECSGYLYVHTCHQMYESKDGLHHQANMSFEIKEEDMSITDSNYGISNNDYGYVSHSFNQYIVVDNEKNIVTLNHGDAFPRAAALGKYKIKVGEGKGAVSGRCDMIEVLGYQGNTGVNMTGASVGGLEYSDTSYLTAGSSVYPRENPNDNYLIYNYFLYSVRNIYITTTDRNDFSSGKTTLKWITDYTDNNKIFASTPQLVKLGKDSFLLLWAHMNHKKNGRGKISYVYLDGNGKTTSPIYTEDGNLSDCKPIVTGNKVVWYVADDEKLTFYTVNKNGKLISSQATFPSSVTVYPKSIADCRIIFTKIGSISEEECTAKCFAVIDEEKVLTEGKDYQYRGYGSTSSHGMIYEAYPHVEGIGKYIKSNYSTTYPISQFPTLNSVTRVSSGNRLEWKKEYGIGYSVFRKVDDGEFINIKKIDDYETTSWVDMDVDSDKQYSYYIKAYTTDGVQEYYSSESNIKTAPATSDDSTDNVDDVEPTWKPSDPSDIQNDNMLNPTTEMKIGSKITDKKTKAVYKITGVGEHKTAEYEKCIKGNITSVTIPASVKLEGKTYKVTSVGKSAFRNSKKLKKIKIGKNVKLIGKQAFYKCKKLRYFLIRTNKLTLQEIGKNAFGGGYKLPKVKTDKHVKKQYYRFFTLRGMSKKAEFITD